MWRYIIRRVLVMIPTLFGVTIISFAIMQLAPGDPLLSQSGARAGNVSQSREVYLVQKRALQLDKPILLNFNTFRDYTPKAQAAAFYLGRSQDEIERDLTTMAEGSSDDDQQARLKFLRSLGISDFDSRLADSDGRAGLAQAVVNRVQVYCEDQGEYAVPATLAIVRDAQIDWRLQRGAIRALNHMVVDPLVYTYSRNPSADETPHILACWQRWWEQAEDDFSPVPEERAVELSKSLEHLTTVTRLELMEGLEEFQKEDVPFFADTLLGRSTLQEKNISALVLRLLVGKPLATDVPLEAQQSTVEQVAGNWITCYQPRSEDLEPGAFSKAWSVVADTQYAHMVWRLATFNFGRSALKTREPVGEKIWRAVKVSAPLMLLSEILIYVVAVPLGILCATQRGKLLDRVVSVGLFVLYSVPAFVAAMMFLLFLCYGTYFKLFPMSGLHSEAAESYGFLHNLADYAWHAFLPVVCLALFSLAGLAMYARSSMLDVIGQDYVRTARAKGVPERLVIFKHALRNALIPVLTLFADFLPAMFGGSVLVEVLFGIPGMGRLSWTSIGQKDYPTLMALIYIDAIVVMGSILLSDILYVIVDPRISYESEEVAA